MSIIYLVIESNETPEYLSQVSHHDDDQSDHGEGYEEAGVATHQPGWRDDSEDQLEILK